jgi:hypothetical protein
VKKLSDEDFKIFAEDIVDYCNAVESAAVKLRMQIEKLFGSEAKVKGSTKLPFVASKIQWQDRENEKGKFQVSEDYSNPDHKALLKFLNEVGGCVASEGWFYWIYRDGSTVGRKLRRK